MIETKKWTFLFSIAPFKAVALAKDVAINLFASFNCFGSWLLFYLASHIVIALPSIASAIVETLSRSSRI